MATIYIDSSAIIAIAFAEPGGIGVARQLNESSDIWSSNLLEAEVRAAYSRVGEEFDFDSLAGLNWVFPDRPLTREISMVVEAGYLRGADLWHLATALYMTPDPAEVTFITLDERQAEVARTLGFPV